MVLDAEKNDNKVAPGLQVWSCSMVIYVKWRMLEHLRAVAIGKRAELSLHFCALSHRGVLL